MIFFYYANVYKLRSIFFLLILIKINLILIKIKS